MRSVLQVGSSLYTWGGIERYVVNLSQGLQRLGCEVDVACPPGSPLSENLNGVHQLPLGAQRPRRWSLLSSYLRLFQAKRYDVVHTHYSVDFIVPAIAAKVKRMPRMIMSRHLALPWYDPKRTLYSRLYDKVICVSEAVRDRLQECGIPPHQLIVVKMGIAPLIPTVGRTEARMKFGIGHHDFAVGFMGRLIEEKGVDIAIKAIAKSPRLNLHIVGDGPYQPQLERIALQEGIAQRVKFHGYQQDVANAALAMDLLLIPSRWDEAFPAVALEAMSVGCPIIAAKVGGLPELIEPDYNGLLFEKDNVSDLAGKIQFLEHNRAFGQVLGQRGKQFQASEFSVDAMARRFMDAYQSFPAKN